MMHGRWKSDSAIVAEKSVNKAELSAAELMERRAGAKGNKTRAGHRTGQACHKRWNAYDKQQGRGRRNGSPRSSTMSALIFSGSRSLS